jgi:hypothetical protein
MKYLIANHFLSIRLTIGMPQKRKAASEILREISETRKVRLKEPTLTVVDEWEEIDLVANSYRIIESDHVQVAAILNYPVGTSLLDAFMSFVAIIVILFEQILKALYVIQ